MYAVYNPIGSDDLELGFSIFFPFGRGKLRSDYVRSRTWNLGE